MLNLTPEKILDKLDRAIVLKHQIKKLSSELESLKDDLKDYMSSHEIKIISELGKATYSSYLKENLDLTLFKQKCPKIYKRYTYTKKIESILLTDFIHK